VIYYGSVYFSCSITAQERREWREKEKRKEEKEKERQGNNN